MIAIGGAIGMCFAWPVLHCWPSRIADGDVQGPDWSLEVVHLWLVPDLVVCSFLMSSWA